MKLELLKETFGEIVQMYWEGCDVEGMEEDFEMDFDIFCDKFCIAKGDEVNEFLKDKILEEFENRISPFQGLDEEHRLWAIKKMGETFFNDSASWYDGESLESTAQDYISSLGWKQVTIYDEEEEEEVTYIFDFSDATFDVAYYLDYDVVDLPQEVIEDAEVTLCYY